MIALNIDGEAGRGAGGEGQPGGKDRIRSLLETGSFLYTSIGLGGGSTPRARGPHLRLSKIRETGAHVSGEGSGGRKPVAFAIRMAPLSGCGWWVGGCGPVVAAARRPPATLLSPSGAGERDDGPAWRESWLALRGALNESGDSRRTPEPPPDPVSGDGIADGCFCRRGLVGDGGFPLTPTLSPLDRSRSVSPFDAGRGGRFSRGALVR